MKQSQTNNLLSKINYSLKHMVDESALKYKVILNPIKQSQGTSSFNQETTLVNKSKTSKCFVNAICLNKTFNKLLNDSISLNINEKYFIFNESEIFNLIFDFKTTESTRYLIENNKIKINILLLWLEYDPFLYCHQLIHKKLQSELSESRINKNEFDLDRYIYENILLKQYNFMSTATTSSNGNQNVSLISNMSTTSSLNLTNEAIYSNLIKKVKLTKDDLIKYFKSILNYNLVTLVLDLDPNVQKQQIQVKNVKSVNTDSGLAEYLFKKEPIQLNESATRYSLSNEINSKDNQFKLGSSNSLGDLNNSTLNLDCVDTIDYTTSFQSIDNLLNSTFNKTIEEELKSNKNEILNNNGWSISVSEINLLINENNFDKQVIFFELKNHLKKELLYDVK
jgi:hypothetical protein